MPAASPSRRPVGLALLLVIGGVIGFSAAFALTLDKFAILADPEAQLSCNFSVLIGCSTNLNSAQGAIFGFPNPLMGVVGWTAAIAVGAGILAGARYARWFWLLFNAGVLGALVLVVYLIHESLYSLFVLCPWCMVTWAVTIPVFLAVTLHTLRTGILPAPARLRRAAGTLYGWVPAISVGAYLVVFVLAQLQLDVINRI